MGAPPRHEPAESGGPFDPMAFRAALGQFPTGVCVVTARARDGTDLGMTMSSFNALSLDPPLVLFSIDRRARGLTLWRGARAYAVNVLAENQRDLSDRFARPGTNKWEGVDFARGIAGAPLLPGAAACFQCRPECQHDGGDHVLFLARVIAFRRAAERMPLIFCKGRYGNLDPGERHAPIWPLAIHY